MRGSGVPRRTALLSGAAAAALPLVHTRTAHAAGKLSVGFWDHWVPAGNDIMRKQVAAFADRNKVDVQADFITSIGSQNVLTIAAEAQARTGHDIHDFFTWGVQHYADQLEPMDDVMGRLVAKYGPPNDACEYLAKIDGRWLAVPASSGAQNKVPCARVSILKTAGIDVQAMYPATVEHTALADGWTWDSFLTAAEACHKMGRTFGIGLGQTSDSVDFAGALFAAFGAELVTQEGDIAVKSDAVREVLEYAQRLVKVLPSDAVSYDDASNNRALISGQSALIFNPPSAWAVAKRDNPNVAADCWTFQPPIGPKGRFAPYGPSFWGVWNFSPNKTAAKELIEFLMQREQVEARCTAVDGYDLPPYQSMLDFKVWEEVAPPKGTVFNYPTRPSHKATPWIALAPAPPAVAVQAYNTGTNSTMLAKLQSGSTIPQVIDWAQNELEGFVR